MKYVITEKQYDIFFRRRLSIIDKMLEKSFKKYFDIYKCDMKFENLYILVNDEIHTDAWYLVYKSTGLSFRDSEDIKKQVGNYLEIKKQEYEDKYNSLCGKSKRSNVR